MSEFSTEELISWLKETERELMMPVKLSGHPPSSWHIKKQELIISIIARLRAADKLCEAAVVFISYGRKCPPGCPCGYDKAEVDIRKAIAEYDGKEE